MGSKTGYTFKFRNKTFDTLKEIATLTQDSYECLKKRFQRRTDNKTITTPSGEIITLIKR